MMKNWKFTYISLLIVFSCILKISAQNLPATTILGNRLSRYFLNYKTNNSAVQIRTYLKNYTIDDATQTFNIIVDESFSTQDFAVSTVNKIYNEVRGILPSPYNHYHIKIFTNGIAIDDLISDRHTNDSEKSCLWGDLEYKGFPWVKNISCPNVITHGLADKHISIWASHGRYYDNKRNAWKWQRPNLFCTNEDLFTQTIVVPYLIPMLENAGAVVFSPRERDWQKNEFIVDNDNKNGQPYYQEICNQNKWSTTINRGFGMHDGPYADGENPFEQGTARMARTTPNERNLSKIIYQPLFTEEGRYAVYVSYQSLPESIDDAQYIVCHRGQRTMFSVNQQMGERTWVYLGTFDFDKGCSSRNCVILTNKSSHHGLVTADAVRFGGGMGNIQRGGSVSGLPRALEGARYYAQWAGAPYSVYSSKNGLDDYGDDMNARSYMTNWLMGGSVYAPTLNGKKVPVELSLAIHSDAGYSINNDSIIGSLAVCTTNFNDERLNTGISRQASHDFADALLSGICRDLRSGYGKWNRRELFDKNYSETRNPEIPSAILETMSHQNFNDMLLGQDPNFRFTLARSIYKTILRFITAQHGRPCIIEPLTPDNFSIELVAGNKIKLTWNPVVDTLEKKSNPTSYNVYTSLEDNGYDNGININKPSYTITLKSGKLYRFKITAVNRGGESFPTEELAAYCQPNAIKTILIVNGFHRLSSPAVINSSTEQGFDLTSDPGVTNGITAGWAGKQQNFDKTKIGIEGPDGLGYCGDEMAGQFISGNTFNYVSEHARSIINEKGFNIVSCSNRAIESNKINLLKYQYIDLILGLEKNDYHSLKYYKTFSPIMQSKLSSFLKNHGRLFVSGSYIGSDMKCTDEQNFLSNILKLKYADSCKVNTDSVIMDSGLHFNIYHSVNEKHYAATSPECFLPVDSAYSLMRYSNGNNSCICYDENDYRCITMGFPFECIALPDARDAVMDKILKLLSKQHLK